MKRIAERRRGSHGRHSYAITVRNEEGRVVKIKRVLGAEPKAPLLTRKAIM